TPSHTNSHLFPYTTLFRSEVVEVAKEYLTTERKVHKYADSEYLLLTERSSKMNRDAVNKLLKKHGDELGITMRPHKFRHTFCTRSEEHTSELQSRDKLVCR